MSLRTGALIGTLGASLQIGMYFVLAYAQYAGYGWSGEPTFNVIFSGSMVQQMMWAFFLYCVFRESSGVQIKIPSRRAAFLMALVLGTNAMVAAILPKPAPRNWSESLEFLAVQQLPFFAWLLFVVLFALGPDMLRARLTGLALAVINLCVGLYTRWPAFGAPGQISWSWSITTIAWLSELVFLWAYCWAPPLMEHTSPDPDSQVPAEPAETQPS